ncbi:MAG: acetyl-CoA carboxylase biotin carboxylase subunit, partial [Desulfuromonadales bacterium]|nr:acetyl-CoA carboxylase biotin carboxylase subunit [Desulfuromonadales bacterium]
DSAVYDQYTVLPHYDSMIAKLIVHADTREEAIQRMARALDEYIIGGIKTTIDFHKRIMHNKEFIEGKDVDTGFLERLKI